MFAHEFSDAVTRIRKFMMQARRFFCECSQGNLTAEVLALKCFALYSNNSKKNLCRYIILFISFFKLENFVLIPAQW